MKAKHTPGPWKQKGIHVVMSDGFQFKQQTPIGEGACCQTQQRNQERREANARLIASAPDLLEALEIAEALATAWVGYYATSPTYGNGTEHPTHTDALAKIKAAIAKAKGESHE